MAVVCPRCGFENSEQARFCGGCAAPLEAPVPARETRKTVTVVFCDVTGSTALGERLDPESLRRVMARYFEAMREAIERHGGTVEKFIGDAVMAVFGVPVVHEDDALRAVRAADAMCGALATLNEELERDYGIRLEARIGVNTGEVVTGTEERLATGDAVNVAARLEQAAGPGEVLIGRETYGLTRDTVQAEELDPLELKGKAAGVTAYRLLAVGGGQPARRSATRMIGRQRELRLLNDAWERAVSGPACVLFTLLGVAGVGKSRLTAEFLAWVDATVVEGRCLSYGDGITYWPVTEVVLQLGAELPGVVGGAAATSPEEIAFSFRRLLEAAARDRPLVVLFDDCHWGEPTFLDLVEHVATMSRDAPILLFCVGRPDLLERRPQWGGGMLNATTVLLEPLSAAETDEMIEMLGGVDAELAGRIRAAADGNPLFVEEMLAMVNEGGDVTVPPTVQALLAARLDQLDPGEREVLERGSVEGHVFHRGAVQALGTAEPVPRLTALVRKDIVRPEQATFAGEDAYRFRHILIRDAAYDALPKATRAELHERFAGWLEEHGADLVERDEIIGYHLEQAFRFRSELGPVDGHGRAVGRRASEHLESAGDGATLRGDVHAASSLLGRALDLREQDDPSRLDLALRLVRVLEDTAEFDRATQLIDEVSAAASDDPLVAARAELEGLLVGTFVGGHSGLIGPALARIEELSELFESRGAHADLARALAYRARFRFFQGSCSQAVALNERAILLGRECGLIREVRSWNPWRLAAHRYGATPVEEAIRHFDEALDESARLGSPASILALHQAVLLAMAGRGDEGRDLFERTAPEAPSFGLVSEMSIGMEGGLLFALLGEFERAAELLRGSWERTGALGETGFRATIGGELAEVLVALGRDAEAAEVLDEVETFVAPDDVEVQVRTRWVRATMLLRRGRVEEAERLAREAVGVVSDMDYIDLAGDAHRVLGEVLAGAGREREAGEAFRSALDLFERKGNVVRAAQVRERLERVHAA